jgi:hypothetical protein
MELPQGFIGRQTQTPDEDWVTAAHIHPSDRAEGIPLGQGQRSDGMAGQTAGVAV